MAGSYDGKVVIDTKIGLEGLKKGLKEAERDVAKFSDSFNIGNKAIKAQETEVAKLKKRYDEISKISGKPQFSAKEFNAVGGLTGITALKKEAEELNIAIEKGNASIESQIKKVDKNKEAWEEATARAEHFNKRIYEINEALAKQQAKELEMKPMQDIQSQAEKIAESIRKQREEQKSLQELLQKSKSDLESAKVSGDKLAESFAQISVDKALAELEKIDDKTQNLYYEAEKLSLAFNKVDIPVENLSNDELADFYTKTTEITESLRQSSSNAKSLSQEISNINSENIKPIEENFEEIADNAEEAKEKVVDFKKTFSEIGSIPIKSLGGIVSAFKGVGNTAKKIAGTSISAFRKLGSVFGTIALGAGRVARGILTFGKNLGSANKNVNKTNFGLRSMAARFKSILAGAVVFNVISKALNVLRDNLGAVLMTNKQFAESWNAIRVNLLTAFAPIWEVIQPAIITFMDLLARFTSVLAQFMATLFGKTYQQAKQSAKGIYDIAKATDKAGKAAKGALAPFDELIVLTKEMGEGEDTGLDFESVEAPDYSWIDEFIEKLNGIFDVFKDAWNEAGQPLADAFVRAKDIIIEKFKEIANSFYNVWTDGTGLEFLTSFLTLLTTILNIIGDISEAFRNAWTSNGTGEALIQSFFTILTSILNLLNDIGNAFRQAWIEDGSGEKLITSFLKMLTSVLDLLTSISEAFRNAWNDDDRGKTLVSAILKLWTDIFDTITSVTDAFKTAFDNRGEELFASILELLKTILLIINDIMLAFKNAWEENDRGVKLAESLLNTFTAINDLLVSIGESFREAWNDGIGESIMENILEIATNLNDTIATIAGKIQEAWEYNDNGIIIWENILGIVDDILETFNDMSFASLEWAKGLDLEPLITAFKNLLEAMRPFINIALDGLEWIYNEILLPMSKWAIETLIPKTLDLVSAAIETLTTVVDALKPLAIWIWEEWLQPIGEWAGKIFIEAIETITKALTAFTDWAKENPETIETIAEIILGFLSGLWIYNTTKNMITFMTNLIAKFKEFGGLQAMFKAIAASINLPALAIGALTAAAVLWISEWDNIKNSFNSMSAWQKAVVIILGVAAAIAVLITALTAGIAAAGILAGLAALGLGAGILAMGNSNSNTSKQSADIGNTAQGKNQANSALSNLKIGNYNIPKLARGGIVDSATIAQIGEKGREAVLPLERNTEWMDSLAAKISNRIGENLAVMFNSMGLGQSGKESGDIVLVMNDTELARTSIPAFMREGQRLGIKVRTT